MSLETLDQPEHTDLDLDYCQIRRPRNIGPGFLKKHSYHAGIGWIGVGGDGWVSLEIRGNLGANKYQRSVDLFFLLRGLL